VQDLIADSMMLAELAAQPVFGSLPNVVQMPDEPACKRVRISNLLTCTVIDGAMLLDNVDIDDLAMSASDLLDQFRKRGMPDTIHRKILDKTYDANNLEKLNGLVAKFEAAIRRR
jgi:hypothetical protein